MSSVADYNYLNGIPNTGQLFPAQVTTPTILPNYANGFMHASSPTLAATSMPSVDLYGGDLSLAGTAPLSMWESFSNTMKGVGQTLQDWGVTGGKNPDGSTFNGWGGLALGAAQGIGNIYMGLQQKKLMEDQLNFSKEAFNKNYAAQRSEINSRLSDRQAARVASNPGAYQSVGEYMDKYGVK